MAFAAVRATVTTFGLSDRPCSHGQALTEVEILSGDRPSTSYDPPVTSFETLLYSKDDGIASVSLNRPQVRNAINQQMQDELREVWHDVRYDSEVRCVVLTAEGEAFCTGIDRAEA